MEKKRKEGRKEGRKEESRVGGAYGNVQEIDRMKGIKGVLVVKWRTRLT